jgi:hypothetical protein
MKIKSDDNLISLINSNITIDNVIKIIFAVVLLSILYINIVNISNPILDQHGFRQTQTALTAYYILDNGFTLNYQTPVIGESWSIPFEFPIYQFLAAILSSITSISLTNAGKLLNLLFTIAVSIPVYLSLKKLGINKAAIIYSIALYLSSPIYLFWAGTFMIEGTALFFATFSIYFFIKICCRKVLNCEIYSINY